MAVAGPVRGVRIQGADDSGMEDAGETTPLVSKKSTFKQRRRPALLEADDSEEEMTWVKSSKTVIGAMLGDNTRFDWIVEADAFQDYPGALFWARLMQIFISMVVIISLLVMFVYYCLGVIQTDREYYWYSEIEVPTLVVCPDMNSMAHQPTGNLRTNRPAAFTNFSVMVAAMDAYPDSMGPRSLDHTVEECVERAGCQCIEFPEDTSFERQNNRTDIVRVVFRTTTNDNSYLFGFHRNSKKASKDEVPTSFAYGSFGMKMLGYVTLRLVDRKSDKFTGFFESMNYHKLKDMHIYDWMIGGLAVPSAHPFDTEVVFGMKSFQVARDQTFTGRFSPFAILTLLAVCMSILNNLNVFGLMFPVQDHPVFTQREPSTFFRNVFSCFHCVQRRKRNLQKQTRLEKLLTEHQEQLRFSSAASPKKKKKLFGRRSRWHTS